MDIDEALWGRRTIGQYKADKIDPKIIEQGLQAALQAPNHKNTRPWRFYRLGPKTRQQLADLALTVEKEKSSNKPWNENLETAVKQKYLRSDSLLIIARANSNDPIQAHEDYAAIACAIQNLFLFLHSRGVGSKWGTGRLSRDERIYRLLEIDRNQQTIEGFVYIGIPERVPAAPPRPPLSAVLTELP